MEEQWLRPRWTLSSEGTQTLCLLSCSVGPRWIYFSRKIDRSIEMDPTSGTSWIGYLKEWFQCWKSPYTRSFSESQSTTRSRGWWRTFHLCCLRKMKMTTRNRRRAIEKSSSVSNLSDWGCRGWIYRNFVKLSHLHLICTNFSWADLLAADFTGSEANGTNYHYANLLCSEFSDTNCWSVKRHLLCVWITAEELQVSSLRRRDLHVLVWSCLRWGRRNVKSYRSVYGIRIS